MKVLKTFFIAVAEAWPFDRRDALFLAGATAVVYGVSLVFVPAAWMLAGALALAIWSAPLMPTRKKGS